LNAGTQIALFLAACVVLGVAVNSCGNGEAVDRPASAGSAEPSAPRRAKEPSPSPAPLHQVDVVHFGCERRNGFDRAEVTIRNTGTQAIPYAMLFAEFSNGSKTVAFDDTFFTPSTIPPGAMATATARVRAGLATGCHVAAIQDGSGNRIQYRDVGREK
jgi:hypothetical protein